ncbi:DsbA family protein [Plesiocystis pacifica]|uniref:DsbA family protein n=1 Tax=Plesiocystis pacifica TaxID=191768 RepID=UPI000A30E68A|nr:thioredoxin domain-containing protein [Plesiocystis pacifica]
MPARVRFRVDLCVLSLAALALSCTGGSKSATQTPPVEAGEQARTGQAGAPARGADSLALDARAQELADAVEGQLEGERFRVPVSASDLSFGAPAAEARITIVVFSDYQCPYCGRLHDALDEVAARSQDVRVVYKHFPLAMHGEARDAALALLAAQRQGRGLELHRVMFERPGELSELEPLARAAGIQDVEGLLVEVGQGMGAEIVDGDIELGKALAVRSTPSYFINGLPVRGARAAEQLEELIAAEREQVDHLLRAGAHPAEVYPALMALASDGPAFEARKPSGGSKARPGRPDPEVHYAVPVDGRPTKGRADALVTLIAFGDMQCPFCRKAEATLDALAKRYGKDLRIVYRHNPLPMHAQAKDAALALVAADRQGEFFAMRAALYEAAEDGRLAESGIFSTLARQLGLDIRSFKADMADPDAAKIIAEDQKVAQQFGATGTPAFFVNGRFLSGAQPEAAFAALIDEELDSAKTYLAGHRGKQSQLYAAMSKSWATKVEVPPVAAHSREAVALDGRPVRGVQPSKKRKADIEILTCLDFDCPYCARWHQTIDEALADGRYSGKVSYAVAHFPLPMHKDAEGAHRAAIAAGEQGKFWEMHDLLFADKSKRSEADYLEYARFLQLDVARFSKDLASAATQAVIDADKQLCSKLGVSGTPHSFVNGRSMRGALPMTMVGPVLDEELAGGFEAAAK